MSDRSRTPQDGGDIPYIGPVWPITKANFDRLNDEQREQFWWLVTYEIEQRDTLRGLLWNAGIEDPGDLR